MDLLIILAIVALLFGASQLPKGSFPRKGNEAFWVEVVDLVTPGDHRFRTADVPSFGF